MIKKAEKMAKRSTFQGISKQASPAPCRTHPTRAHARASPDPDPDPETDPDPQLQPQPQPQPQPPPTQGRASESDRRIATKRPKHLFSGKRGMGKTDRR